MIEQSYLGYETEEAEGYMQPHKYRVRYRCLRCAHEYTRIVKNLVGRDSPCPRKACKDAVIEEEVQRRAENLAAVLTARSFPGITGDNPMIKTVDKTAEMVMQDYGLTDLKDNIREGESMAPKLPPAQQAAADNFFSPKAAVPSRRGRQAELLGRRALAGVFRGAAVSPGEIFRGNPGDPVFRKV